MTMKSLLSTVPLALVLGGSAATAQAQVAIGHLADYSGATSDVGTPYGQGVADTFAWVNKHGGIGGKQLNVDALSLSDETNGAFRNISDDPNCPQIGNRHQSGTGVVPIFAGSNVDLQNFAGDGSPNDDLLSKLSRLKTQDF